MNQSNKSYSDAVKSFQSLTNKKNPEQLWKLGEILSSIKNSDEYEQYCIFSYFLENEEADENKDFYSFLISDNFRLDGEKVAFDISEEYVNKYMKIYELIPLDILKSIPNTLAAHLYDLIEVDEQIRNNILDAMRAVEREYPVSNIGKHKKLKLRGLYRSNDIKVMLSHIQSNNHCLTSQEIKKLILNDFIALRINEITPNKQEKYRWGTKDINPTHFYQLKDLHPKEPVDEQSFVGLFCTMFHLIKDKPFKHPDRAGTFKFSKIIYIRSPFPDASIKIYNEELQKIDDDPLKIEFEYRSYTYVNSHQHHLASNAQECDLIICWENNWEEGSFYYAPIISIKELLETGEIKVHYFNTK